MLRPFRTVGPCLFALLACRSRPVEPVVVEQGQTEERVGQLEEEPPAAPAAAEPEALPEPLTEYMGRRIAQTMHWTGAPWLVRESREAEESGERMRAALGLREGMVVCDFGAGNGYHSLAMAESVGAAGRVLAVDIQPEMLTLLEGRAREAGITNVESVLATAADPNLPERSCDLVLLVDVYHELGYPEQVLAGLRRALRPAGLLVLVEFRGEDPEVPIKLEHKMTREQVQAELSANGFRLEKSYDELPWQHMLFFALAGD